MPLGPISKKLLAAGATLATAALAFPALASRPEDGKIWFQPPATPLAEEVHFFHNLILMPIITVICVFVLALLLWIVIRYNSKANPVAKKFSHNMLLEVVWTAVPIFILLFIALFSFDLLYKEDVIPDGKKIVYEGDGQTTSFTVQNDFVPSRMAKRREHVDVYKVNAVTGAKIKLTHGADYSLEDLGEPIVIVSLSEAPRPNEAVEIIAGRTRTGPEPFLDLFGEDRSSIVPAPSITIKASGRQWGWDYSYPDFGDFEVSADIMPKDQLDDPSLYLLAATNNVVVPEGETVRIITTAIDVIHSWAMPAFALKVDAVPGRLNETWFRAPAPGMYYGQCSEICGLNHAYMPIALEVMSREDFDVWVNEQRAFAGLEPLFGAEQTRFAEAAADAAAAQQ